MTAGAHESGAGFGKSAGVNAARGVGVIVVAVVVGMLLMMKGLDENDSVAAAVEDTTTTTTVQDETGESVPATAETADTETTTETVVEAAPVDAARAPADVQVLVINGASRAGVAGRGTDVLIAAGYATATPDNANADGPSAIFYSEGFRLEAEAIAAVFGIPVETTVIALTSENLPVNDTQGAKIVVRVGNDNVIQV